MMKGISLACFALLALGALKCFHCLACGVMNWAISFLSPKSPCKRDLCGLRLKLKEVDGHCMSAPTTQPSSFFPNPFFPNPNLKNHASELC